MKTISRNLLLAMRAIACALFVAIALHFYWQHQRNQKLFANLARVSVIALGNCDPKKWELEVTERISDPKVIMPILEEMRRNGAGRALGCFCGIQGPYLFLAANGEPVYWAWYYPEHRYLHLMGAERKGDRYKAAYDEDDQRYITVVDYPGFPEVIIKASACP